MTRAAGRILAMLSLAGALFVFLLPISNPDIYWHLSAGRWIAEHRAFPYADWLSFTRAGAPWSDFEWGVQVLWLFVERAAGFAGLWLLKAASFAAAGGVLWRLLGLYEVPPPLRGAGLFLWSLAVLPANDLRPENVSVVFFLLLLSRLERGRVRGAGASARREGAYAALFFSLWANLHAGFVYGLLLLGIYSAAEALRRRDGRALAPVFGGAAGALLNPYGTSVYGVPWEHFAQRDILETHILEWQEASVVDAWLLPFWVLFALSFAAALKRAFERKLPPEHAVGLSIFALSAAAHVRTGVYFSSLALPYLLSLTKGKRTVGGGSSASAGACFAACAVFFAWRLAGPLSQRTTLRTDYVPVRLSGFLEKEKGRLGSLRMYNPWHWGGYLGWRLHPNYPVFYDGRYLFHDLLKEAAAARATPEAFVGFLDERGIRLVLLRRAAQWLPEERRGPGGFRTLPRPFYHFYLPPESWALIYWDGLGLVFVSREAVSSEWLAENEYRYFRPEDLAAADLAAGEGAVRERLKLEILRHYERRGEKADPRVLDWLKGLKK